ncbi:MAG: hypothetical protein VW200_02475 [Pelagibacteraceae bacterium]|jgi:hypothetical protein
MTEEKPKKINWEQIIRTSKISIIWYIIITAIWWLVGVYPHMLFSLDGQIIIAGLASLLSYLQTQN